MSEETWKDRLPEQLQDAPYFKNAESPEQVLADLNNAAQWQGNSLRIPGENATPEQVAEFQAKAVERYPDLMVRPNTEDPDVMADVFASLGRPDTPDGYTVPDGVEMDVSQLKAFAHANNLTREQFKGMVAKMHEQQAAANEQYQADLKGQYETLYAEWGAAAQQNMDDIGKLLADAPEAIKEAYANKALPADQLRWLHQMSQLGTESAEIPGQVDGAPRIPTPEQAELELAEVEARLFSMQPSDPSYAALNRKRMELIGLTMGQSELPPLAVVES